MSVLSRIAHFQNRRDEVPNRELARSLADRRDTKGVREIARNLRHEVPGVQSDCLKVLYEIGFIEPRLIAGYVDDFVELSQARNNRLVWGSMIALSTIADLRAGEIYAHAGDIQKVIESGSVITIDNGIKTLAIVAAQKDTYRAKLFPYLLKHLQTCRPQDVPQHAEHVVVAVSAKNRAAFVGVLEKRMKDLSASQATRVRRVIKQAESR
jgi:hypothetical protein